jgi:hypothetical protein
MIEAFSKFRRAKNYNCDITISCALNVAASIEDQEIAVYSKNEKEAGDNYGEYVENNYGQIEYSCGEPESIMV